MTTDPKSATSAKENTMKVTNEMVDRFLSWPLPESVCADLIATKQGPGRIGTNLLTFNEAKQMLEHVLTPAPSAASGLANDVIERCAEALEHFNLGGLATDLRALRSHQTPVGEADPEGAWAILYEDASKPPEVFFGAGAEQAARRTFEARLINWNCYLLANVPTPSPQTGGGS